MQKCMFDWKCTLLGPSITESVQTVQTGCSDDKQQVFSIWLFQRGGIKHKIKNKGFASKSNRIQNLVQKSNLCTQSEMTLLKQQQDFSISAFQWGGVECKIKNMHHHFHCACIQVVANDHRNTIVTHTLIMKRTPHYVKVEKTSEGISNGRPILYSNNQQKNGLTFSTFLWQKKGLFLNWEAWF